MTDADKMEPLSSTFTKAPWRRVVNYVFGGQTYATLDDALKAREEIGHPTDKVEVYTELIEVTYYRDVY